MNSYAPISVLTNATANLTATGIVTKQVVSEPFVIKGWGSRTLLIKVKVGTVTHTGTQTVLLQTSVGGSDWEDSKSFVFTANSTNYLRLNYANADDKAYLPLGPLGRIVITQTDAADRATVTEISVVQQM